LGWFIDASLQRNAIAELMDDWAAGTLDNGTLDAYA
jgi:hypothetical protein